MSTSLTNNDTMEKNNNDIMETTIKGRKINDSIENPIDLFLIEINTKLNPLYYNLNFTPNTLTSLSLVITLLGLYLHSNSYFIVGGILYFIGYYFDCADGNYARTYNMTTKFGDLYDHISDFVKFGLYIYLLYSYNLPMKTIIFISVVVILLLISSGLFLGCQESIYAKNNDGSDFLKLLKKVCYKKECIHIFKYGSTGTLQLFCSMVLMFLPVITNIFG